MRGPLVTNEGKVQPMVQAVPLLLPCNSHSRKAADSNLVSPIQTHPGASHDPLKWHHLQGALIGCSTQTLVITTTRNRRLTAAAGHEGLQHTQPSSTSSRTKHVIRKISYKTPAACKPGEQHPARLMPAVGAATQEQQQAPASHQHADAAYRTCRVACKRCASYRTQC
jgi:hypothetical protein